MISLLFPFFLIFCYSQPVYYLLPTLTFLLCEFSLHPKTQDHIYPYIHWSNRSLLQYTSFIRLLLHIYSQPHDILSCILFWMRNKHSRKRYKLYMRECLFENINNVHENENERHHVEFATEILSWYFLCIDTL